MSRESESRVAMKLQSVLGSDYVIKYDDCESCITRCFYKGELYKEVDNGAMVSSLNVIDFHAPKELVFAMAHVR